MAQEQFDVAVVYTDGSHLTSPDGTGAGIHAYCFNDEFVEVVGNHQGVILGGVTELVTPVRYEPFPNATIRAELPKVDFDTVATFECAHPLKPSTSQVGELMAFLTVFNNDAPFTAKTYNIHTDSMYLINGYSSWMHGWKKKGWVRGNGEPVGNKSIWIDIHNLWTKLTTAGIKVNLFKIKGHSGRYGNDAADRLAGNASATSLNMHAAGEAVFLPSWSKITEFEIGQEKDEPKRKSKSKSKGTTTKSALERRLLPDMATQKLFYVVTNEPTPVKDINGIPWHYLLSGDHAKNKDDLALVGKYLPDTMFSIMFTKEPMQVVIDIANKHAELAWGDTPLMYRYDAVGIVSGLHINRKKFAAAWRQGVELDTLELRDNNNVMMFDPKTYICQLARPPLLSYRSIEIRDELAGHLEAIVKDDPKYTITDITGVFFDEADKPTKAYRNVDRSITVNVKHGCSDKEVPVILSRGIDIPNRTDINRTKKPDGRYVVATWLQDKTIFRYAVVYTSPEEHGLWIGYYSATRVLTEKEL